MRHSIAFSHADTSGKKGENHDTLKINLCVNYLDWHRAAALNFLRNFVASDAPPHCKVEMFNLVFDNISRDNERASRYVGSLRDFTCSIKYFPDDFQLQAYNKWADLLLECFIKNTNEPDLYHLIRAHGSSGH